jgi:hypothetical protein
LFSPSYRATHPQGSWLKLEERTKERPINRAFWKIAAAQILKDQPAPNRIGAEPILARELHDES